MCAWPGARAAGAASGVIFYLAVTAVAPFALGPDLPLLARIGPALLWIAMLLALLLGLERLFQADHEDGTLDQLRLADTPLVTVVLAKAAAHWTAAALPLIAATPLAAILLNLSPRLLLVTLATLVLGTPALALIGAVGCRARRDAAPRGGADRGAGAAAVDPGGDLRRGRGGSGGRGSGDGALLRAPGRHDA